MQQEYPKITFAIVSGGVIISLMLAPGLTMSQNVGEESMNEFVQTWIKAKLSPQALLPEEISE